jgi:hypothetical protein
MRNEGNERWRRKEVEWWRNKWWWMRKRVAGWEITEKRWGNRVRWSWKNGMRVKRSGRGEFGDERGRRDERWELRGQGGILVMKKGGGMRVKRSGRGEFDDEKGGWDES